MELDLNHCSAVVTRYAFMLQSQPIKMSRLYGPPKGKNKSGMTQAKGEKKLPYGLLYFENYITPREKEEVFKYLNTLYPIWEMRFSKSNPPPAGQENRQLLRPVYWLGNWQFACLNYYHPPKGIENRCVQAEPYPPILESLIQKIENIVRETYNPKDIPRGWHLNTCLINFYGDKTDSEGKKIDCARVGEHKDFEPGPVASISFGERAIFQFVASQSQRSQSQVVFQQWLDDSSLQIFGGDRFKKQLFHRVQRVEKKNNFYFPLNEIQNFETRRINFTFRYVPKEHFIRFQKLPTNLQQDVLPYMQNLARHSAFFASELPT
ncbi:MAG: alpha-ketoglutarate-dependent dioxygenase AlkB [Bdellovibrionia bacterium]